MMNHFYFTFRQLFRKKGNQLFKIVAMGAGLALCLVMVAEIYFIRSYENFYPDLDRLYQIQSNFGRDEKELDLYPMVSGGVAPGLKAGIPAIEAATRVTGLGNVIFTLDRKQYAARTILADTTLFDVLPVPVLIGDPKSILSHPMSALVSRSVAERLGGVESAIGKCFYIDDPDRVLTIEGIFENLPENTHLRYDIVVSMESIGRFMWDGRENWDGNDRYRAYVKLYPGVSPERLKGAIREVQYRYQDEEEMKRSGISLEYILVPMQCLWKDSPEVRRMTLLIGILAFVLIFTAMMNYILVVISSLVNRTREVGVYKCYGASARNLAGLVWAETIVHLSLSLCIAALLIFLFRDTVEEIYSVSIGSLFTVPSLLVLGGVSLFVLFVTGWIPAMMFVRIPVSSAFRSSRETRRFWKLSLLFVQFGITAFLVLFLAMIHRQYDTMVHDRPGYAYEHLLYCSVGAVSPDLRQRAVDELERLPEVDRVSSCSQLPFNGCSGNPIFLPDSPEVQFIAADLYGVGRDYLGVMEIPVVAGSAFRQDGSDDYRVMVSRSFAACLAQRTNGSDGVVGKKILIGEHSQREHLFEIWGVYENIRLGSLQSEDSRPSMLFYDELPSSYLIIRLHRMNSETIGLVSETLERVISDRKVEVYSFKASMTDQYNNTRLFRNTVLIGGCVALLIALMGLIGYTNDEINRRSAEIAIHKINGARPSEIRTLFVKDILLVAVPAIIIGGAVAVVLVQKWQEQFVLKVPVSVGTALFCGSFVLFLILLTVGLNVNRIARQNPVESLRNR